jgi:hypothetical protein
VALPHYLRRQLSKFKIYELVREPTAHIGSRLSWIYSVALPHYLDRQTSNFKIYELVREPAARIDTRLSWIYSVWHCHTFFLFFSKLRNSDCCVVAYDEWISISLRLQSEIVLNEYVSI